MEKFFDRQNKRLLFIREKSDSSFWDKHWNVGDLKNEVTSVGKYNLIVRFTKKYLKPSDGPILEGGCGIGQNVYALNKSGFTCIGIDYAKETVEKVNKFIPEIDVRYGDVKTLEFEDNYFAGYWSLGVIEHFLNGYETVLSEMKRVIKQDGYLFLTFPYMSPLRIWKAKMGFYPIHDPSILDDFYQFALDYKKVLTDFAELGFRLKYKKAFDGVKGFKDEFAIVKGVLQRLYDYKGRVVLWRGLRFFLSNILSFFAGHIMLLVLRLEK